MLHKILGMSRLAERLLAAQEGLFSVGLVTGTRIRQDIHMKKWKTFNTSKTDFCFRVTLRLAVYRQSVYLRVKPFATHEQS
jgi:hypothetical protein